MITVTVSRTRARSAAVKTLTDPLRAATRRITTRCLPPGATKPPTSLLARGLRPPEAA